LAQGWVTAHSEAHSFVGHPPLGLCGSGVCGDRGLALGWVTAHSEAHSFVGHPPLGLWGSGVRGGRAD